MTDSSNHNSTPERVPQSGILARMLDFPDRTLPALLQRQAVLGERVLLRCAERELSYGEAPDVAARYASRLAEEGVGPGDTVAVFMSNKIELIELWFAIAWLGAIMVPINTALRGEQLRHAIGTAEPLLLIMEADYFAALSPVEDIIAQARAVFAIDIKGDGESIGSLSVKELQPNITGIPAHPVAPGDTAAILYTSGTTGAAKGVLCPHAQFYWWGTLTGEALGLDQDDTLFTVLPMFHTNALNTLWQAMLYGATYSFAPAFSARNFWRQAYENGATATYLLGSMAQILLKQPVGSLDKEHSVGVALCPATPLDVVEKFHARFGVKLIEGYGSTETNFVFSNTLGGYAPASMGRVTDGFEVRIVDKNDCDVEEGKPGELIIRQREPFSMSQGYYGNPLATVKAWRNLWFHTGDQVFRDSEGIYHFLGRLVDAIRRRGENISSWEVESALMLHSDVEEAAVIGVPSDLGSEEDVMAFVVMRPGCTPDHVNMIRFLESRLAYFAIPRYWEFPAELPRTQNNKIKKHALREIGVTSTTWDFEKAGVVLNRTSKRDK
ncbi:AMP-binding protein [Kineobactrum salinum]|uniref:AMP-binding protein n=1 Tax=Kineobactrum salinum TaxID=2708301 RepID=A0A6C0TZH1_9GAMM|nr:AMP-binding protein [Kineobactrum salinum]QIB64933.1 AMP-binding protein [Kineobactrum salinum]